MPSDSTAFLETLRSTLLGYGLDANSVILVAMSGGPDSTFLLENLYRAGYKNLHIVHVNHRLRPSSDLEAEGIWHWASHGTVHLKTLEGMDSGLANLEEVCREARYAAIRSVYLSIGARALLLGHHGMDQAETVLKRFFEGANLYHLSGMKEESWREGMRLLRPLLHIDKTQILEWLKEEKIAYVEDESNSDVKILRGRMRQELFPFLEKSFGKGIAQNIGAFSKRMRAVTEYIDQKSRALEAFFFWGPLGAVLDLFEHPSIQPLEVQAFLAVHFEKMGLCLNRSEWERLLDLLKEKKASKRLLISKSQRAEDGTKEQQLLWIHRGLLWVPSRMKIDPEDFQCSLKQEAIASGWRQTLRGEVGLPEIRGEVVPADLEMHSCYGSPLKEWYAKHQVPRLLYEAFPIIVRDQSVVYDWLTGHNY